MRELTRLEREVRQAVRNFLYCATPEEMQRELEISLQRNDALRAEFIKELQETE